jgi:NADH:ubiquinone oxidoreductase subunit K
LNEFLYSAVGVEPNGVTLSLVSVFARRGTDPWTTIATRLVALLPTRAGAIGPNSDTQKPRGQRFAIMALTIAIAAIGMACLLGMFEPRFEAHPGEAPPFTTGAHSAPSSAPVPDAR